MAGESPDRSKQRESSAEPTPGSASPVPGSDSERRDPRLAVARETSTPSTTRSGGVDTATKVLSRRELEAVRAELEGAGGAEPAPEDAEPSEEPAEGAEGAEGSGAVADERADERELEGEGEAGAGSSDGAKASGDGESQDEPEARDEPEAADTEGAKPSDGDAGGEDSGKVSGEDASGDDRLKAAVAAWVATADADGKDAAATSDADASDDAETADAETDAETDDDVEPAGADADEPAERADTDAKAETAADAETSVPDTDDETPAADTAEGGSTDEDVEPAASGEATADADAPSADEDEDTPQGTPAPDDESGTEAGGEGKAVDQPTAVFKAVRPTKPHVDQPTTMLKAPKPEAPAATPAPEETPAERTSKFVALKPDIHQAPPKAPETPKGPAPDVTAAVPQIGPERTTQQPLPPKPPLDLLAELTNTPPPPDTPVRTAIRRVKIWTPLVVLLAIVFAVVQSVRPLPAPTLDLTAKDSYTFEGGKVDIPWPADGQAALDVDGIGSFGSSGDQKPVPIASVAKVMTAYLILREHPLDSGDEGPKIKIDQAAEDQSDAGQESTVNVTAGDKITQREALESILIASANNVARLLARWDAGSEKAFVSKMNAAAEDLGMTNTTYTDPSGLNNTTVSTAVDQVKLAKAAMKFPGFREVAAMMSYDDYKSENHGNWNQLVGSNGVVGIKTGTTTSALGNLVFAAKKEIGGETRTVIGAVVRQPDAGSGILAAALDSGDRLIRAAQGALEAATILKKGDVVGYVDDGLGGRTAVVAGKDVTAVGWAGLKVKLTFAPQDVPHTAKAGTQVGTLTVGDGSSGAVKIPVALKTDLTEPGFTDKLTRIA
ncbi:D-alanyl-D-alanine carboxypeptidase [Streptomyces sp. NPDC098781]|uniref:D-alanyl-D-alanine carboxypeptidase n=1 Tax=Streptomyces sp. NPDC098781 TaxID=3366097 RepID=UPI0037F9BD70